MRKQTFFIIFLGLTTLLQAQKVDSIKVEQTGDFIKIGYQILDSKPGEVYRVRVLCSINGGLNTEIRSVSGDTGDNVQGGKSEYFVIWDVLKDVDQLTSAEFIIRAELKKDNNALPPSAKNIEITNRWSKKWIHIGSAIEVPGPKPGLMIGVMGSFGAAMIVQYGKYATDKDVPIQIGVNITLEEYLEDKAVVPTTFLLTKRVVNYNTFQMHAMAGFQRTRLLFLVPDAMDTPYQQEKLFGPAVGLTFDINMVSVTLIGTHIDPGPVEKEDDWMAISPLSYISLGIGIRF